MTRKLLPYPDWIENIGVRPRPRPLTAKRWIAAGHRWDDVIRVSYGWGLPSSEVRTIEFYRGVREGSLYVNKTNYWRLAKYLGYNMGGWAMAKIRVSRGTYDYKGTIHDPSFVLSVVLPPTDELLQFEWEVGDGPSFGRVITQEEADAMLEKARLAVEAGPPAIQF